MQSVYMDPFKYNYRNVEGHAWHIMKYDLEVRSPYTYTGRTISFGSWEGPF